MNSFHLCKLHLRHGSEKPICWAKDGVILSRELPFSEFQIFLIFFFFFWKWVNLVLNPCKLRRSSSKYDMTMNWDSTILGGLPGGGTNTAFRKESGVGFSKDSLTLLPAGRGVSVRWHVRSCTAGGSVCSSVLTPIHECLSFAAWRLNSVRQADV